MAVLEPNDPIEVVSVGLDSVAGSFGHRSGIVWRTGFDGNHSGLAVEFESSARNVGGVTATASGFVTAVASHFRQADGHR